MENPERSLELQLGDQPTKFTILLLRQSLGNFTEQFLELCQSKFVGSKFSVVHKNMMNLFMNTAVVFRFFNYVLLSDVYSIRVSLKSMFINGLNRELSLLVKKNKMEWETAHFRFSYSGTLALSHSR